MSDNYPHGLFSWADLASPGPQAAKEFYTGLFGWEGTDQTDPEGNFIYTMFTIEGRKVAGKPARNDGRHASLVELLCERR